MSSDIMEPGELENLPDFVQQTMERCNKNKLRPEGEAFEQLVEDQYGISYGAHAGNTPHDEVMSRLRLMGVPERIRDSLDKGIDDTEFVKEVRRFAECKKNAWCLVLSSDKGAGKSTGAAVWLYDVAMQMEAAPSEASCWWPATRLARANSFNKEYERIIRAPHMVIDDLGMEYMDKNGNMLTRLDELIDERYSNFRRIIITTNLNMNDFKERYGDRIADRIRDSISSGGNFFMSLAKSRRGVQS
jgi:hypothetical protein